MIGEDGESQEIELKNKEGGYFNRGQLDRFRIRARDVGRVSWGNKKIELQWWCYILTIESGFVQDRFDLKETPRNLGACTSTLGKRLVCLVLFVCFSLLLFCCCCCLFALSAFTIKRKHKKGCMKCYRRCHRLFMRGFRHVFSRACGTDSDEMPAFDSMNSTICLFCTNNVHVILF